MILLILTLPLCVQCLRFLVGRLKDHSTVKFHNLEAPAWAILAFQKIVDQIFATRGFYLSKLFTVIDLISAYPLFDQDIGPNRLIFGDEFLFFPWGGTLIAKHGRD